MARPTGIVYVPLNEELIEVQKVFPLIEDYTSSRGYLCYLSRSGIFDLIIACRNEQGTSTAHATIYDLRKHFDAKFIFCLGIAGTLSKDAAIGDVCFSQEIIDINENQKIENGKTLYNPRTFNSNEELDKKIGIMEVHPNLLPNYQAWMISAARQAEDILANFEKPADFIPLRPKALRGPIVCGPVVDDADFKRRLKSIGPRKVLAIETETAGIYQALTLGEKIEVFAIRGISDSADGTKSALEKSSNNAFRRIAAGNAASFLALNLESNSFLIESLAPPEPLPGIFAVAADPIAELIRVQEEAIKNALLALSPEYRATEKGYVLPVPRVRRSDPGGTSNLEPAQLIAAQRTTILELPVAYPDKGLPWLYARSLLGQLHADKVVVPVVLDFRDISPPKKSLQMVLEESAPGILTHSTVFPVIIIVNSDLAQERKLGLILVEAKELSVCSILVVHGSNRGFLADNLEYTSWKTVRITEVSFSSIVKFLLSHFEMLENEAEVVAMRLSNTFRAHNLPAHPSYFAGIPKEMLYRLADANHRAELIDLAVTGFLSFLGAGGTSKLFLKQRTRRLFLREIAYQIVVQKTVFNAATMVAYVKNYSDIRDFGLNSLQFVDSFIDNGILNEEPDGAIVFSIPFIQNYLLAEKLSELPEEARKYFDPSLGDFDMAAFELYCEIGLSDDVLSDVRKRLAAHIQTFEADNGETPYTRYLRLRTGTYKASGHMLTSGATKPALYKNIERSLNYRENLLKSAKDLVGSGPQSAAKQEILDLSSDARNEARAQTPREAQDSREARRHGVARDWNMAIAMLGSAAEQLPGDVKQSLGRDILRLGALAADDWIRIASSHDYNKIKEDMFAKVADRFVEDMFEKDGNRLGAEEKVRSFVDLVVNIMELELLNQPFISMMGKISEGAKNSILYNSVVKIEPMDTAEELILSLWKLELNETKGLEAFNATLKKLPKDTFLRSMVATYLVSRAYWYRPTEAGRRAYSVASQETLKPTSISMPVDDSVE